MPTLLHLDSSAGGASSRSRAITATFADAWRGLGFAHTVTYRDLNAKPIPHLPDASLHWPAHLRAAGAEPPPAAELLQAQLVAELRAADVVLIGSPLYNYSMPSSLKAWVDHIHLPAVLGGPAGKPLAGRPVVVVTARGALYDAGSPTEGWDHGAPVLELVLGTSFGMDVTVITTDATLADVSPALAKYAERAADDLAAAHARAAELARELG